MKSNLEKDLINSLSEQIVLLKEQVKTANDMTQVYKDINLYQKEQIERLLTMVGELIEINKKSQVKTGLNQING